ncbi:TauD/TfdA dioxygenase family protein [Aestuariispira insulae]|uniref:Taurine dioxygenase n=1 Tax=Aestuariispira insulae TaxID=1461337 RepID=A0A3D9H8L0_9PROT|nr:TauD/TfdA family dioxygenase [Aestuariispira insulae]RED45832.1 taurine dioxygenase [Aestuariispira insulae]
MDEFALEALERQTQRHRTRFTAFGLSPVTPVIGAEITGLDLAQPLNEQTVDQLRQAWLENHVLVFRNQELNRERHKEIGRLFGELRALPVEDIDGDDPEITLIRASKRSRYVAGAVWHTDGTAEEAPSMGSMLYMHETPEGGAGGDTLFANMHLAYEMLSPAMRGLLDGLTAIHDGAVPWRGFEAPPGLPKAEHPAVVRHPETGRKCLFVNGGFTTHIPQLSPAESDHLLAFLFALPEKIQALNCRIRWQPGTLVLWDNRCTQHHAIWDYYPLNRAGERITLLGQKPEA